MVPYANIFRCQNDRGLKIHLKLVILYLKKENILMMTMKLRAINLGKIIMKCRLSWKSQVSPGFSTVVPDPQKLINLQTHRKKGRKKEVIELKVGAWWQACKRHKNQGDRQEDMGGCECKWVLPSRGWQIRGLTDGIFHLWILSASALCSCAAQLIPCTPILRFQHSYYLMLFGKILGIWLKGLRV